MNISYYDALVFKDAYVYKDIIVLLSAFLHFNFENQSE